MGPQRPAVPLVPAGHSIAFALLSFVDSTPVASIYSLEPRLRELEASHWKRAGGVVVEFATLRRLVDASYFHGYDEVWLFEALPRGKSRPPRFWSLDEHFEPPARLTAWMRDTRCSAGLGDGYGLNWATYDPALAALWRQA